MTVARQETHVLLCPNAAYFQHAAVAVVSLAASAGPGLINVYVFTLDETKDFAVAMAETLAPFPNVRLMTHRPDPARVAGAFVDRYLTGEAYLRFLAADLLPQHVERLVYLDSDLVLLDDIHALAAAPLAGKAVGAVPEWAWSGPETERRLAHLGIVRGQTYVNSGVLVMDLGRWRRERIAERLFDYVAQQGSRLAYHDQDALNAVLADDIALLDLRWNLQPLMLGSWARAENPEAHARARAARRNPGIVHFTTERKPWKHRARVRDRRLYFRFLAKTAWRRARPPLPGLAQRIEYDLARSLLAAGIDLYAATAGLDRLAAAAARFIGATPPRRDSGRAT